MVSSITSLAYIITSHDTDIKEWTLLQKPWKSSQKTQTDILASADNPRQRKKSYLEDLIKSQGHICDFCPKYHCELNFIEQYWGAAKLIYRSTLKTIDMKEMERNVRMSWQCAACSDSAVHFFSSDSTFKHWSYLSLIGRQWPLATQTMQLISSVPMAKALLQFFFLMLTISPLSPVWMLSSHFWYVSEACLCMLLSLNTNLLLTCSSHYAHHPYSMHTSHYFHAYHLMHIILTPCAFLIIYIPFTICTLCLFLTIYIHASYTFHASTTPSSSI